MSQYTTFRPGNASRLWTSRGRRLAGEGLQRGLEHVLFEAQKIVPLDEGTLERSGRVIRDGLEGAISFDTVYARRQHEELTWKHLPGRKAKYLEIPMNSERDVVLELMAVNVRRWFRG
ncbi:minor capsid protein [Streptomyces sp. MS191]|uniref:minor capsid protein n=1 Tax=Streptomyces sp. ms191 TaxID=1827978 RepID=UPI001C9D09B2|nr:minor capsid protein [Streptomyces sp. ms191]